MAENLTAFWMSGVGVLLASETGQGYFPGHTKRWALLELGTLVVGPGVCFSPTLLPSVKQKLILSAGGEGAPLTSGASVDPTA